MVLTFPNTADKATIDTTQIGYILRTALAQTLGTSLSAVAIDHLQWSSYARDSSSSGLPHRSVQRDEEEEDKEEEGNEEGDDVVVIDASINLYADVTATLSIRQSDVWASGGGLEDAAAELLVR